MNEQRRNRSQLVTPGCREFMNMPLTAEEFSKDPGQCERLLWAFKRGESVELTGRGELHGLEGVDILNNPCNTYSIFQIRQWLRRGPSRFGAALEGTRHWRIQA
jgi:hypothetical protein